jgi:hypothetical protein
MNGSDIYIKTEAGVHEVKSRARQLPQRLRTMLIMVDGSLSVEQLRQAADRLGAPEDFLVNLESQGLVQRVGPARPAAATVAAAAPPMKSAPALTDSERFAKAKQFMNDTIVDSLGLRAFFFTLKLEKCFTLDDLQAILPEYSKAIARTRGDEAARTLEARARDKLR